MSIEMHIHACVVSVSATTYSEHSPVTQVGV